MSGHHYTTQVVRICCLLAFIDIFPQKQYLLKMGLSTTWRCIVLWLALSIALGGTQSLFRSLLKSWVGTTTPPRQRRRHPRWHADGVPMQTGACNFHRCLTIGIMWLVDFSNPNKIEQTFSIFGPIWRQSRQKNFFSPTSLVRNGHFVPKWVHGRAWMGPDILFEQKY